MNLHRSERALIACYAITIFISAFLVFQLQPIIAKIILPWFGGTPAVWTTCLLFFQILLFAGYAYAHLTARFMRPLWQGTAHLLLIVAALWVLPITPDSHWKPIGDENPTWRILLLLLANVGLPYFLLSSTGPLLQSWFSRQVGGGSPYRLYALSNVGSLAALLTYPLLFEPNLGTSGQDLWWSLGFCVFALVCGYLAATLWRAGESTAQSSPTRDSTVDDVPPGFAQKLSWLLFPAFASAMLLAFTNHVCTDIVVVPFLWVVPLSLYLLSFILCFDSDRWYSRQWCGLLTIAAFVTVCLADLSAERFSMIYQAAVYFAALFFLCMICHGELVQRKPAPKYLTSFYLMCSAGGAIGGLTVAVICQFVFSSYFEMHLGLVAAIVLACGVRMFDPSRATGSSANETWRNGLILGGLAVILLTGRMISLTSAERREGVTARVRNFYGILQVNEQSADAGRPAGRTLVHGRTVHGFQFLAAEDVMTPTTYYARNSGIGVTLGALENREPMHVGIIGLGCGTLAAYGRPGDTYRFYEINPACERLARQYFTFLDSSRAEVEVVLGDARISLDREDDQQFDVLVLDAFSSDAIPAHLLTTEALDIYLRHLRDNGILAVHASNRHLDLNPVVSQLARHHELDLVEIRCDGQASEAVQSSIWFVLTRNESFLNDPLVQARSWQRQEKWAAGPLWTDQYHSLFKIIRF